MTGRMIFVSTLAAASLPAAAAFTPNSLFVLTSATTGASGVATAAALSINEYAFNPLTGTFLTTPIVHALTGLTLPQNNGDHDGLLHLTTDRSAFTLGGYSAPAGTASVVTTAAPRVIGTVSSTYTVATTPVGGYTGLSLRSVASTDGRHFWTGGDEQAAGSALIDGGQYYIDATGPTPTQTLVSATDARGNTIDRGQLWTVSSSAGGAGKLGVGLPTSAATTSIQLPGGNAKSDVVFLDLNNDTISDTAYTTDGKGVIGKWLYDGSAWSAAGVFSGVKTSINDINALSAFTYNGAVQLIASTAAGQLFQFTDTNNLATGISFATNTTPTPFLTAGGTTFRGLVNTVPEPAGLAAIAGVAAVTLRRRRAKGRA